MLFFLFDVNGKILIGFLVDFVIFGMVINEVIVIFVFVLVVVGFGDDFVGEKFVFSEFED